jgi:glyoxylase-like metal-dependent hydrolase (beta-lactamase superfamily II)
MQLIENDKWGEKERLQRIGESLYVYRDTCNVYVIRRGQKAILIDFGSGEVMKVLEDIQISCVEAVLVTHHHRDQVEGLYRYELPVYVPHMERRLLDEVEILWQSREIYNNYNNRQDRFSSCYDIPVAGTLEDYHKYSFMGYEFEIIPTPGHTVGSVSIGMEMGGEHILFSGDLVYRPGKVWSLAATQWSYNGGEGIAYSILSMLDVQRRNFDRLLPAHGDSISVEEALPKTIENLAHLREMRHQNPRLFLLRDTPFERITEHLLFNRTSMANSYVILSDSGKALLIDYGYDFMAGLAAGTDQSARRPWLYNIPALMEQFGVTAIDACISTHYHDDHVAGFHLLRDHYQTRIMCAENYADVLEHPDYYDVPCLWYDSIPVDIRLPLETPVPWEEYEIILHPLSGHTKYSVAIEVLIDGKKVLFGGDQYAERTLPNFVYKNLFHKDDFIKSAMLYRKIAPDIIATGHWPWIVDPDENFYEELEDVGRQVSEYHEKLLPENWLSDETDDFICRFYPYQKTVKTNETFCVRVRIRILHGINEKVHLRIKVPKGFGIECEEFEFGQKIEKDGKFRKIAMKDEGVDILEGDIRMIAPHQTGRRMRITASVSIGARRLGEQAEMLVTVIDDIMKQ